MEGFYSSSLSPDCIPTGILFREALCVVSALVHASTFLTHHHVVIYTDSGNSVDIFSSLHAPPTYNSIFKHSADVMIDYDMQLKVLHVPGQYNQVADALS
jgi:hypothetical protein